MHLDLQIECDNAAFDGDSGGSEVARILRKLADKLDGNRIEEDDTELFDINGNCVGAASINDK